MLYFGCAYCSVGCDYGIVEGCDSFASGVIVNGLSYDFDFAGESSPPKRPSTEWNHDFQSFGFYYNYPLLVVFYGVYYVFLLSGVFSYLIFPESFSSLLFTLFQSICPPSFVFPSSTFLSLIFAAAYFSLSCSGYCTLSVSFRPNFMHQISVVKSIKVKQIKIQLNNVFFLMDIKFSFEIIIFLLLFIFFNQFKSLIIGTNYKSFMLFVSQFDSIKLFKKEFEFKKRDYSLIIMDSARTTKRLEMLQDYPSKYKKLKHNLNQSQNLNKQLKSQLLKLGSQCNTVFILITKMSSQITDLKSQLLKGQKQLSLAKQQLRRIQYKTQKLQIKHKQYIQRVRRFQQMHSTKQFKNLTLKQKINKMEQKLIEQRLKECQLGRELSAEEQAMTLRIGSKQIKQREYRSVKSCRGSLGEVVVNSSYQLEVKLLGNDTRVKRLRQEKEEAERRNGVVKSSINKIQIQIASIAQFIQQNTSIPSLSSFQSIKSKSTLQDLVQKHEQVTKYSDAYVKCLEQNYKLITQYSEVNKLMGTDVMDENARIAAFAIRGKMYTDKHRKTIVS